MNRFAAKRRLLERLQRENKLLRELRRLELLEKYGPSAETLSVEQFELLELEPGVSTAEIVSPTLNSLGILDRTQNLPEDARKAFERIGDHREHCGGFFLA
jgi:hypothetical protein